MTGRAQSQIQKIRTGMIAQPGVERKNVHVDLLALHMRLSRGWWVRSAILLQHPAAGPKWAPQNGWKYLGETPLIWLGSLWNHKQCHFSTVFCFNIDSTKSSEKEKKQFKRQKLSPRKYHCGIRLLWLITAGQHPSPASNSPKPSNEAEDWAPLPPQQMGKPSC